MIERLTGEFNEHYGTNGMSGKIMSYFAPGRVNLIGEHIDYNGGCVFPCALDMGTYMLIRKRKDSVINFISLNKPLKVSLDLKDDMEYATADDWANYPKGIIRYFKSMGINLCGMDILYYGSIPNGSGLSSSASLEVVTAYAVNDIFQGGLPLLKLVQLSQEAEQKYIGVNCGIMDQFAVGFGKKNTAILLDTRTLDYQYAPINAGDFRIVICNSNKKRGLADSKYNERRAECESALKLLKKHIQIENLCDLTVQEFERIGDAIENPVHKKRAQHAVYENARVKQAVSLLKAGDIAKFGELMVKSHYSLKELYEVSCFELDVLVEEALKVEGTLGARMTGAGFGGCTVNIVKGASIEHFVNSVSLNYEKRTGLKADIYIAGIGDGVRKEDIS